VKFYEINVDIYIEREWIGISPGGPILNNKGVDKVKHQALLPYYFGGKMKKVSR